MRTLTQAQKILGFLEAHAGQTFTARQIAVFLITEYAAEYARKRANPRFADDKAFLSQIIAEIGSQKDTLVRANPALTWQDRPKPRRYCIPLPVEAAPEQASCVEPEADTEQGGEAVLLEQALYPLLISYLSSELHLYSLRIRESCSRNTRGRGRQSVAASRCGGHGACGQTVEQAYPPLRQAQRQHQRATVVL